MCVERPKTLARQLQITRRFATSADQSGRGFTRQLRSHVRKANGRDRIHLDLTVIHAGTLAHSDMRSVQIRTLQVNSPRRFKLDDHESVSRTVAAFKRTARPSEGGPDYDRIMDEVLAGDPDVLKLVTEAYHCERQDVLGRREEHQTSTK